MADDDKPKLDNVTLQELHRVALLDEAFRRELIDVVRGIDKRTGLEKTVLVAAFRQKDGTHECIPMAILTDVNLPNEIDLGALKLEPTMSDAERAIKQAEYDSKLNKLDIN